MNSPSVCAILLTADRPEMTNRAVESFRAQTYENKRLVIWDTSHVRPFALTLNLTINETCVEDVAQFSVGSLRNRAAEWDTDCYRSDIFIHWDSDDYSHPNRISEQVAFLQSSGADVVGYSDLLFWKEELVTVVNSDGDEVGEPFYDGDGQAYLYTARDAQFAPGTSLCYWRRTWEAKPFPDISQGEDYEWLQNLKLARHTSLLADIHRGGGCEPRMIASIHGGNTSTSYNLLLNGGEQAKHYMRRVPEFDSYCRERMNL